MDVKLTADVKRKYAILVMIEKHRRPMLTDIARYTQIPIPSIKRHLAQLRTDFSMDIRFIQDKSRSRRVGYYQIYSWGVFDRTELLLRYAHIFRDSSASA